MAVTVITFPGSNCDRDCVAGVESAGGVARRVFHKEHELPADTDAIILPGGFSFGDYLRCGAMASRSHIMGAVRRFADAGGPVLGICNGFQILCEAQMLPGALLRNAEGRFVCEEVELDIVGDSPLLSGYQPGDGMVVPVAHGEGNYICDAETLKRLEAENRVVFRYAEGTNPNGALNDIAGIMNESGSVIGMMPHPENMIEPLHGRTDCRPLFESLLAA